MSKYFVIIIVFFLLVLSCKIDRNPTKIDNGTPIEIEYGGGFEGLVLFFKDTCSYSFVTSFLDNIDSIQLKEDYLGFKFKVYADSGNFKYWENYFCNDPSIKYVFGIQKVNTDSVFLELVFSGINSVDNEKLKISEIPYLEILEIENYSKKVLVGVPENSESFWAEYFSQYSFIIDIVILAYTFG